MGLGTKIKEVLHSDKETKHTTADTSKTPGAYPSEEVPRSHKHADTSALESSGSPRTDKVPGKNSSEYTYGANDSSVTGRDGLTSDRHDTTTAGSHDRTGSRDLTGSHHNKLSKDSSTTTAPYWGDAERTGGGLDKHSRDATTTGATGGRYSPTSRTADNDELNHGSHTGVGGGRDATYGSGGAAQTHGLTGAGGSATTGLAHRPLDTDAAATNRRDHKIDEYDAPTNSHGRGHGGHGGLPGAAGAGLGAAALANQHHREDMRDYDTQRYDNSGMGGAGSHGMGGGMSSGRGFNDSYDNPMSPGGNNGYGGNHGMSANTMGHNGMGSNTMGHNGMGSNTMGHNGMGSNTMGHNGMGSNAMGHNGMGGAMGHNTMGGNGMGMTHGGVPPGMPGQGPSLLDPHSRNTSPQQAGGAMGGPGGGSGYGGSNGGSEYGGAPLGGGSVMPRIQQNAAGMGDGHFGPGHPGAKVLHRCDHCGNDNDISKYFSKEAVYRMS